MDHVIDTIKQRVVAVKSSGLRQGTKDMILHELDIIASEVYLAVLLQRPSKLTPEESREAYEFAVDGRLNRAKRRERVYENRMPQ